MTHGRSSLCCKEIEPAASRVGLLLTGAETGTIELFVSVVDLGEVYYRVGRARGENEARETLDQLRRLSLTTVHATDDAVFAAAG